MSKYKNSREMFVENMDPETKKINKRADKILTEGEILDCINKEIPSDKFARCKCTVLVHWNKNVYLLVYVKGEATKIDRVCSWKWIEEHPWMACIDEKGIGAW